MYAKYIKRKLDFLLAALAILILGIPLLLLMLLVRIDMGSPVIFTQERIGKDEKPFLMYKLRSMITAYDKYGVPLPDEKRITRLGKIMRKTSLDELPSLVNILKGDMSFVGPRPLPTNYLPWFTDEERRRHTVRGGLTGLAQVHGRNSASWEERFRYDLQYVDNITFLGDIKILFDTVKVVLLQKDIGTRGVDTPADFHVYRSGMTERELNDLEKKSKQEGSNHASREITHAKREHP